MVRCHVALILYISLWRIFLVADGYGRDVPHSHACNPLYMQPSTYKTVAMLRAIAVAMLRAIAGVYNITHSLCTTTSL